MDNPPLSLIETPRYRIPATSPTGPHSVGIGRLAVWAGTTLQRWGATTATHRVTATRARKDRVYSNFQIRRRVDDELKRRELAILRTWNYRR